MKNFFSLLILVFFVQISFAQNEEYELINHRVALGETVKLICKKYLVMPSDIYQLNKFAVNGISEGMILQIPVPVKDPVEVKEKVKDLVKKENTNIAKTKEIVEERIEKPIVKTPEKQTVVIDRSSETEHIVEPKETLYSLSKKYGVSVDEIKLSNEQIETSGLQIGMIVKIPGSKKLASNETSIGSTKTPSVEVRPKTPSTQVATTTITHIVEPKETLYSLSKKYGVTVDLISSQNESILSEGLKIGQTLTIKK